MKLIMENWRGYQEDLLTEGKILDALKNGFKKLIKVPEKFDQMVEQTKQNFAKKIAGNLEEWAESPEMQQVAQEIANVVAADYEAKLQEGLSATAAATEAEKISYTVAELRAKGVGPETIELIQMSAARTVSDTLIASAEGALGKPAPPALKDWLIRFVSKFVGSFVFGFIDNFIMVVAGGAIDAHIGGLIGGALGSTVNTGMLAAGLGNTMSDAVGELASNSIESAMDKMGLDPQAVTDEEVAAGPLWMRFLDKQASVIGIILGCLVGLFPLFLEEEKK